MTPVRILLMFALPLAACAKWGFGGLVCGILIGGLLVAWLVLKEQQRKQARRRELEKLLLVPPPLRPAVESPLDASSSRMAAAETVAPPDSSVISSRIRSSAPDRGAHIRVSNLDVSNGSLESSLPQLDTKSITDDEIMASTDICPPETWSPSPSYQPLPRVSFEDRMSVLDDVVSAIHPPQAKKLQWIPPGTQIQIAGRTIPGMVYVSDMALGWGSEPSAICLPQQVVRTASGMEDLPYFPNYEAINPNQRAIYLDWLARGRRDTDPDSLATGYLFLFFYGIERRILWDGDRDPALWNEVVSLLHLYGLTRKSWSVASYFGDFLHYTAYAMGPERYSEVCPSLLAAQGKRLSETAMTLALANLFRMGRPVEWDIAHLVAMNLEESRRSVVTERTGDAFKRMFRNRFESVYPSGLALKASKRKQRVNYRSSNSTLSSGAHMSAPRSNDVWPPGSVIEVPGVLGIKNQFKTLSSIWNQCIEGLSGYSRAITRISTAQTVSNQDLLKAYLALPTEIRDDHQHPLADEIEHILQTCPEVDSIRFVPISVLAGVLGIGERTNLTPTQCDDVTQLLDSLGLTLAPHPGLLNLPLGWSQEIAVVRCAEPPVDKARLGGLLRLLFFTVLVASADGEVDEEELQVFHRTSGANDEFARVQIAATEAVLLRDTHVATRLLPRIVKSVRQNERIGVFKLLVHIAGCDDVISSDENRLLRKIAKAFGLVDTTLDDILTEDSAFQTVTVARGRSGSPGETIPGRPAEAPIKAFALDMDKIAALTRETAEVVSILSKALAEEDHGETAEALPAEDQSSEPTLLCPRWAESLDPRYQPALVDILVQNGDDRLDLATVSKRHHLMEDDLVDGLNTWSDEFLGDFLIEDTDGQGFLLRRDLLPAN